MKKYYVLLLQKKTSSIDLFSEILEMFKMKHPQLNRLIKGFEIMGASQSFFESKEKVEKFLTLTKDAAFVYLHKFFTDAKGLDLSDANLVGADLTKSNIGFASSKADLNYPIGIVDLSDANLEGATLSNNLDNCNFTRANLNNTEIEVCSFKNANFTDASFVNAEFLETNMAGANLTNTDFTNVDFYGCEFLSSNEILQNENPVDLFAQKLELAFKQTKDTAYFANIFQSLTREIFDILLLIECEEQRFRILSTAIQKYEELTTSYPNLISPLQFLKNLQQSIKVLDILKILAKKLDSLEIPIEEMLEFSMNTFLNFKEIKKSENPASLFSSELKRAYKENKNTDRFDLIFKSLPKKMLTLFETINDKRIQLDMLNLSIEMYEHIIQKKSHSANSLFSSNIGYLYTAQDVLKITRDSIELLSLIFSSHDMIQANHIPANKAVF